MAGRGVRLVGLLIATVGAVGVAGVATGVAQATVVLNRVSPAYPDLANCTAVRDSFSTYPDVAAATACFYSATEPQSGAQFPGYYFRYALSGDGACGIGCHTPPPPPRIHPDPV